MVRLRARGRGARPLLAGALPLLLLAGCSSSSDEEEALAEPGASDGASSERAADWWRPEAGLDWQWQLTGPLDLELPVPVYDIDAFESGADDVAALHERDVRVICYVNAGAWEDFRPDADAFPEELLGEGNGWPGERWLDIRALDTLRPLLAERFDLCVEKGFDAVEPDLLDGYQNDTGFPLTADDQLAFNRMVAELAHERGLAVGLKNDLDQIPELVDEFDFAVNEECAAHDECELLTPFIEADKPVFHVEYELSAEEFCPDTTRLGLSSLAKNWDLDAWRETC
ncbi:endo alpha-1,4 polygalactosaminidase [Streptomyces sedi]|uniref:Endo alpha-1,4 polygalactosaminidase n=1 Tax=Streptomyces sedi TaxID=555059 RepID=A0A5C4USG4_9ACTN|nr:endo alpha-1,4 polygalactosaminidase [Streptomyces sedi]TNM26458.1 endo alpha-1,4 polygalactosaminidase [Streptomyces sedi]